MVYTLEYVGSFVDDEKEDSKELLHTIGGVERQVLKLLELLANDEAYRVGHIDPRNYVINIHN